MLGFPKIAFFGANHFADRLPRSRAWGVWNKLPENSGLSFSEAELIWFKGAGFQRTIRFDHYWNGALRASEKSGERRAHPTQKPVVLMGKIIRLLTIAGDRVLDPYMGSGTTGVACAKMGRKFIGIEIEREYFDVACRRIEETHAQPSLFVETPPPARNKQQDLL